MPIVFLVAFVIVGWIVAGPLLAIWALNTLFALTIQYSFLNWFAAFVLMALFTSRVTYKSK